MTPAQRAQRDAIRAMTTDERVRVSHALWIEARAVLAAGVRARHPDWTEAALMARVSELMRDAGA